MNEDEIDNILLEVLSFFEEMTFEKVVLDWPDIAGLVTKEEIEASLARLLHSQKIIEGKDEQGLTYKKIMKKKKSWWSF